MHDREVVVQGHARFISSSGRPATLPTAAMRATPTICCRQRALAAGGSEDDLEGLFAHIAADLFTNYRNRYAGTELGFPPAAALL